MTDMATEDRIRTSFDGVLPDEFLTIGGGIHYGEFVVLIPL